MNEANTGVADDFRSVPAHYVVEPDSQTVCFVFNSPHSGRHYPRRFLDMVRLDAHGIRRSEDCHVDLLFRHVARQGAPLLAANFPRAYLDVNREAFELDPKMFSDSLPSFANMRSVRVAGGLGTVPRIVSEGVHIYDGKLRAAEALLRVEHVYKPYHARLRRMLLSTHARFGHAVLVDCHSMPASVRTGDKSGSADFIVGDRFGTSASAVVSEHAISLLKGMGYAVAYNKPYAGGFITEHYGRPPRGLHAIQIEINRGLYLDESSYEPSAGFASLRDDLERFTQALTGMPADWLSPSVMAAE
ncbi:N-formylglutamate amidohydrolase [Zhengella mangrovi]|uniref:N-formylglutamate amidohydrolase n=1 Tax=Zhengella mangrovi TaxID=1982044 RepID=A0A2G1QNY7_9HYPH|nr:N-formylglutamate amidohydrolase [Zhengella mangrovi]PHP67222.1 N-formylglutamate amidohydrolase [Zhengella mangrovi]